MISKLALLAGTLAAPAAAAADDYRPLVDPQVPSLLAVYKDLHAHPSFHA